MLDWFAANKDALIAVAALVSPVVAVVGGLISALVSYRAVVTGPRIQREIAREQFNLTTRQLELQERSIALAGAQVSANIVGASDQKWVEAIREVIAEIDSLVDERYMITETRKNAGGASYEIDRELEIGRRLTFLVAKARLLAGSNGSAGDYMRAVQKWVAERDDMNVQLDASYQVFQQTSEMIEHRNSRFTTRIDSALSRQKGSPTAKSRDIRRLAMAAMVSSRHEHERPNLPEFECFQPAAAPARVGLTPAPAASSVDRWGLEESLGDGTRPPDFTSLGPFPYWGLFHPLP